jgi:hypothetical protein
MSNLKYHYRVGAVCPHCKQLIISQYTHDFRYCFCGYCYVDGGKSYMRMGWGGKEFKDLGQPETVKVRVYEQSR